MTGYNPNVPTGTVKLSQDYANIQTNFNTLNNAFSVNHVSLPTVANSGKHNFVSMPAQGGNPATAANEIATYTKGSGTANALYLRQQNNGTVVQLSRQIPNNLSGQNGAGVTNFSFIPSVGAAGLIMIFGFTTNSVDQGTINFGITTLSGILSIQLSALGYSSSGSNRALVASPVSVNLAAGTMQINLQDVNNKDQISARTVYFTIIGF